MSIITVHKQVEPWQYDRFMELPEATRPRSLIKTDTGLAYKYCLWPHPTHWVGLYTFMENHVWEAWRSTRVKPVTDDHCEAYAEYVIAVAKAASIDHNNVASAIHNNINPSDLTPVVACHGDLTLYNVLECPGGNTYILLDPGDLHGLHCKEIDTSKIMQSLDGFGEIHCGFPRVPPTATMPTHPVEHCLLMTHYVRMLRYVRGDCETFARRRIEELCALLS